MSLNQSSAYLRCIEPQCLAHYDLNRRIYVCPSCNGLLDVFYEFAAQDADELKTLFLKRKMSDEDLNRSGVWRFRELLPFVTDFNKVVTLAEGNTPLYWAERSARYAGLERLRFKHQGLNPTGSFKDNGMTTGVTQAAQLAASAVACASTGNTSASMAAYAARAGLRAFVFIPADQIAYGKLSQSLEYNATVVEIEGNFDDAMRLVRHIAEETEIYLLNSINPFRLEGQKAIAIEMMEQSEWRAPDWIILPGGNLGNSSAFGKALHEMSELGLIDCLPRLAVIQAEHSSPFYDLFACADRSALHPEERPSTLATAIKIGNPVSWKKALRALDWTNGVVERVSEQEIADAKAMIGRDGIGCEPASAASLAGARKLVASGVISQSSDVIAVLTGNLLKDPNYTIAYHSDRLAVDDDPERKAIKGSFTNKPVRVTADKEAIKRLLALESRG